MPKRPARSRPNFARFGDLTWNAVEIAGGWAETSERLSQEERDELARLRKKARNSRTPLTKGDKAKYTSLVVKGAGVERLRKLIERGEAPELQSPRETREIDAADRLRRAAELRDAGVITPEDFDQLKARYLGDL